MAADTSLSHLEASLTNLMTFVDLQGLAPPSPPPLPPPRLLLPAAPSVASFGAGGGGGGGGGELRVASPGTAGRQSSSPRFGVKLSEDVGIAQELRAQLRDEIGRLRDRLVKAGHHTDSVLAVQDDQAARLELRRRSLEQRERHGRWLESKSEEVKTAAELNKATEEYLQGRENLRTSLAEAAKMWREVVEENRLLQLRYDQLKERADKDQRESVARIVACEARCREQDALQAELLRSTEEVTNLRQQLRLAAERSAAELRERDERLSQCVEQQGASAREDLQRRQELAKCESRCQEQDAEIQILRSEQALLEDAASVSRQLQSLAERTAEEQKAAAKSLADAEAEKLGLQRQNAALNESVASLKQQVATLEKEASAHEQRMAELKVLHEDAQQRATVLQDANAAFEGARQSLAEEIAERGRVIAQLEARNKALEEEVQRAAAEKALQEEAKLAVLDRESRELREQLSAIAARNAQELRERDQQIANYQRCHKEHEGTIQSLADVEERYLALQGEHAKLAKEVANLRLETSAMAERSARELLQREQRINQLELRCQESGGLHVRLGEAAEQHAKELLQRERRLSQLESRCQDHDALARRLPDLEQQAMALRGACQRFDEENRLLRQQLKDSGSLQLRLGETAEQHAKELQQRELRLLQIESRSQDISASLRLEEENRLLRQQIQDQLFGGPGEQRRLLEENASLKQQVESLADKLIRCETVVREHQELLGIRAEYARVTEENEVLREKVAELSAQLARREEVLIEGAARPVAEQDLQLQESEGERRRLAEENKQLRQQVEGLAEKLMRDEPLVRAPEELTSLQGEHSRVLEENARLTGRVEELVARLADCEAKRVAEQNAVWQRAADLDGQRDSRLMSLTADHQSLAKENKVLKEQLELLCQKVIKLEPAGLEYEAVATRLQEVEQEHQALLVDHQLLSEKHRLLLLSAQGREAAMGDPPLLIARNYSLQQEVDQLRRDSAVKAAAIAAREVELAESRRTIAMLRRATSRPSAAEVEYKTMLESLGVV